MKFVVAFVSPRLPVPHASRAPVSLAAAANTLLLTLEKPMGLLLEEKSDDSNSSGNSSGGGVIVKDCGETGSAIAFADQIRGAQLLAIGSVNVAQASFETVMDLIVKDESPALSMEFLLPMPPPEFAEGTTVTITVQRPNNGGDLELNGIVGDNLRQLLIDNGVEVYQGFRETLGNCGGVGQCTFCAFDFAKSEGWVERSDYEKDRLKRFKTARLTCLNNIQGPATIVKTKR